MAVVPVYNRSVYKPMSDDPHVRDRIERELDRQGNIPSKIDVNYPTRGNQLTQKVQSILTSCKVNPIITEESPLKEKTWQNDMLVVMCTFGGNTNRIQATKKAIEMLTEMNPCPKMVLCEGSLDGQWRFEYVKQYEKMSYIPIDLTAECFRNFFVKESMWNQAANTVIQQDSTITKLVFLDADCFFVDKYGIKAINDSFQWYDVLSPHKSSYYTGGQPEAKKYNLLPSTGYNVARGIKSAGYPGFSIAMTVDAYSAYFKNELPNPALGMGDAFYWFMLAGRKQMAHFRALPYSEMLSQKYLLPEGIRIGHGEQILGHVDHGQVGARMYKARAQLMKMAVKEPFREVARLNDTYIMGWGSTPEAKDLRYTYERVLIENRRELKIDSFEEAEQYYNWVHGVTTIPPACILPNRFTKNGNKMPMEECAIPIPDHIRLNL